MTCDTNWLKLQEILRAQDKTDPQPKSSKHESGDTSNEATRKRKRDENNSILATREKYSKKSSVLFKKLGLDASAKRNADSARKYWEDEGVVFDVLAAPQVRKRDKDFEKFLLDDLGDVIDGSQTETVSRNEDTKMNEKEKPEVVETRKSFSNLPKLLRNVAEKKIGAVKRARLELPTQYREPTKAVALDCEMVGTLNYGKFSLLARVSIVNSHGHPLYDKYVQPSVKVTDYRTQHSGITPEILKQKGEPLPKVQSEVAALLKGRILVGHALNNDLKVLYLNHPKSDVRDTSLFPLFRQHAKCFGGAPSLKTLAAEVLGIQIQTGEHDSIQDAQTAMKLYMLYRSKWEHWFFNRKKRSKRETDAELETEVESESSEKYNRKQRRAKLRPSKEKRHAKKKNRKK